MIRLASALALSVLTATSGSADAQPAKSTSIVLVHGAFVDGSGWQAVYDLLSKDGYEVLVVQNPTISLEGDVAATERAIQAAKYPVVLVGHSYGGMVITQVGDNPKVRSLAYVAAFAPDAGESVESLNERPAAAGESKAPLLPDRRPREVSERVCCGRVAGDHPLYGDRPSPVGRSGSDHEDQQGRLEGQADLVHGHGERPYDPPERAAHDGRT
jgi:pimeloyl-ACP methyl ester carboxylesterase